MGWIAFWYRRYIVRSLVHFQTYQRSNQVLDVFKKGNVIIDYESKNQIGTGNDKPVDVTMDGALVERLMEDFGVEVIVKRLTWTMLDLRAAKK